MPNSEANSLIFTCSLNSTIKVPSVIKYESEPLYLASFNKDELSESKDISSNLFDPISYAYLSPKLLLSLKSIKLLLLNQAMLQNH